MTTRDFLHVAVHAAVTAGTILRQNLAKPHQIQLKGAIDLVTEMDRLAESIIVAAIRDHWPDHAILAEESGEHPGGHNGFRWLIDPLDGTTNYAHGFPWYAVSVALYEDGQPLLGVVYHPEREELFTAVRGQGAFLNERSIAVSTPGRLESSLLATGFPYSLRDRPREILSPLEAFLAASQGMRRAGSAAIDLCYVACGRFDGFWEARLHPWDTAAAALIVQEAGGVVSTFEGKPFSPFEDSIVASNGLIHQQMLAIVGRE